MLPIGNRVKEVRIRLGISQAELASAVGVTQSAVSQWEQGITEPGVSVLVKVAVELRTTIDELVRDIRDEVLDHRIERIERIEIDAARLARSMANLEEGLGASFCKLDAIQRAKLIAYVYRHGKVVEKEVLSALIDLVK